MKDTTIHDGCRYHVGMLLADDESSLSNNYLSAVVHLKPFDRRLEKNLELRRSHTQTIPSDMDQDCIFSLQKWLS